MKDFYQRSMIETPAVVVNCYDFFDRVFPECGLFDLTEGIYSNDSATSYEQAQKNQINWILDEVNLPGAFQDMPSCDQPCITSPPTKLLRQTWNYQEL